VNKNALVGAIASQADIKKTQAIAALDTIIASISQALRGGDKVTLVGFGTFSVATRGPRVGRNPQDGTKIKIAGKKVAKFKPGKKLSEEVNGKGAKKKK
jgi:DNA-binding protein HU-beta